MSVKKNTTSLPEKFLERLTQIVGLSAFNQIRKTFVARPTTFRVNTIKATKAEVMEIFNQNGFKVKSVSWYPDAFVLLNKSKRELTDLPIYEQGKIYIQSLASMIPPLVLNPQPGEKIFDLTAAPGSKTSQIAALMHQEGELIANDNNKVRFFKLQHNLMTLGVIDASPAYAPPSLKTTDGRSKATAGEGGEGISHNWSFKLRMENGEALYHEYPAYFDKILLDAPCSAEARFVEADIKSFGYWQERKIKETAFKQRRLLFSAWAALKPGGTLVYSTCTFAPEENEVQIARFIERTPDCELVKIDLPAIASLPTVKEWKGKTIDQAVKKCLRIMPTGEIEGFFVAKMKKCV